MDRILYRGKWEMGKEMGKNGQRQFIRYLNTRILNIM
jgi:hypothetical protein